MYSESLSPLKRALRYLRLGLLCLVLPAAVPGQTIIVNNGALIGIGEGAILGVSGDMLSRTSDVTVSTSSTLHVDGNVTVESGTISAVNTAAVQVTGNLTITSSATVLRSAGGSMTVEQNIINSGYLDNGGTIYIGIP